MIAKLIKRGKIYPSKNASLLYCNLRQFCTTPSHAQQYRNLLLQLNLITLKNQIKIMKKTPQSSLLKLRKQQIIDQLCQLQSSAIQLRLKQLSGKSNFQLQTQKLTYLPQKNPSFSQRPNSQTNTYPQDPTTLMKHVQRDRVIKKSLQKVMDNKMIQFVKYDEALQDKIMTLQYHNYLRKLKQTQNTNFDQHQYKNQDVNQDQSEQEPNHKEKPSLTQQLNEKQIKKLKRQPFVNLLFKTNNQLIIPQQKRKYLYEQQKQSILDKMATNNQRPAYQQYLKNMTQIKAQKAQNQAMKGFYVNHQKKRSRVIYQERKDKVLSTFAGFTHFKQMCSNPYLVRFLSALAFDRDVPLELTMIKIAQESRLAQGSFKKNLSAISQDYFIKVLRISTNYLHKVFKKSQNIENKNTSDKNLYSQKYDKDEDDSKYDDDFDEDQEEFYNTQDRKKKRAKKQQQTQKFPTSRQFIDLQLMRFAFLTFEASIERALAQIMSNKRLLQGTQNSQVNKEKVKQASETQVKTIQETLQLSFQIYKTMESLFASIQINDFNDLDKLMHIISKYHELRHYLKTNLQIFDQFLHKHDRQYKQKLQLGLINMVTSKQLDKKNFILKFQARKLNFDIIDNMTSMLKHDNIQITLQNKRDRILKILERFLKVYVENDMVDFLEDQLIYVLVRFLEKEVYLDKKVRAMYHSRVNFDTLAGVNSVNEPKEATVDSSLTSQNSQSHQPISQLLSVLQLQWLQPPTTTAPFSPDPSSILTSTIPLYQQKGQKSYYYMGQIQQLLPKALLYYLIVIIKYKHQRKEITIEDINNFNLLQEWYSEPTVVRLQFLKEEILSRYKRLSLTRKMQYQQRN